jgi:hypothetical protein
MINPEKFNPILDFLKISGKKFWFMKKTRQV